MRFGGDSLGLSSLALSYGIFIFLRDRLGGVVRVCIVRRFVFCSCCYFKPTFDRLSNMLSHTVPSLDLKCRGCRAIVGLMPRDYISPLMDVDPNEPCRFAVFRP